MKQWLLGHAAWIALLVAAGTVIAGVVGLLVIYLRYAMGVW